MCSIYPERPSNRQSDILKLSLLIVFIGCLSHHVVGSSACGYPFGLCVFFIYYKMLVLKAAHKNVKVIILTAALIYT